jgi:hypothetical protein
MSPKPSFCGASRRALLSAVAALPALAALALLPSPLLLTAAKAQTDPLPSWNDGPAKQAIIELVKLTTDRGSPKLSPPSTRMARPGSRTPCTPR